MSASLLNQVPRLRLASDHCVTAHLVRLGSTALCGAEGIRKPTRGGKRYTICPACEAVRARELRP